MINPTIGRVVWFHPGGTSEDKQPLAALVCYVHSDEYVNLAIFDENGVASNGTSKFLWQGEGERPTDDYAEWMPYQKGQAAKTEALEASQSSKQVARTGHTFAEVVDLLKDGKRLSRKGWNGNGMFVFLVPGSTFKVNRPPLLGIYPEGTDIEYHAHVDIRSVDGKIVPWTPSQTDMLAADWEIVTA